MKRAVSAGRKYGVWVLKAVFLLALLLGGKKAQIFWERGLGQFFSCQNIFFYVLMAVALGFAVWKFEDLYRSFQKSERKQGLWYAVYFSVSFALFGNPLGSAQNQMDEFRRVIGAGVLSGMDASKRVHNFHTWLFFFAASFVLFFLLANDVLQKDRVREARRVLEFTDHFIVLADVHLVFRCILYFGDMSEELPALSYSTNLIMLVLMAAAAYLLLHLEKNILAEEYAQLLMAGYCASIPAAILLGVGWHGGKLLVGVQTLACICCIFLAKIGKKQFQDKRVKAFLACGAILCSLVPFLTSFYIELINILNQYGVFVVHLRSFYSVILLFAAVLWAVCSMQAYRKRWSLRWWKRAAYPALVFGSSCLSVQVPLEGSYGSLLGAGHSTLIGGFLDFGSIPLVEQFSGMAGQVWEGVLYGILNQDASGAVFNPYGEYLRPLLAVLFFYLVKYAWEENAALFAALLVPFGVYWDHYGLGMLVCLAAAAYTKKSSYRRAAAVWLAVSWCALYRLDIGMAFGMACGVSFMLYAAAYRKWAMVKPLALTLAGWSAVCAALWSGLCLAKGIDPAGRFREFLAIALPGQNGSYAGVGAVGQEVFAWVYIFVPFAAGICLMFTVFSRKLREQAGAERWLLLLLLGTAYFGNFSRGLESHPLAEGLGGGSYGAEGWSAFVFLAMFFSCLRNNRKLFLPAFMGLILCSHVLAQGEIFQAETIADSAAISAGKFTDAWKIPETGATAYWEKMREKGEPAQRVSLEPELQELAAPYQQAMDMLLKEGETFADFTNQPFLYPMLGRKNPAYATQSPMQLSGEYAQEQFIREVEGVPLVLMPVSGGCHLEGLTNEFCYYKAAEYIYQNYVPLCRYKDSFAIWCLSGRYGEMEGKAKELQYPFELAGYGYDGPNALGGEASEVSYQGFSHNCSVGCLPELWASADREKAMENPVAAQLEETGVAYTFSRDGFRPGKDGNYLLLEARYDGGGLETETGCGEAELKLGVLEKGKFAEKYKYTFTLKEGQHSYLFRVSSDYYWYSEKINAASFAAEGNAQAIRMCILDGD